MNYLRTKLSFIQKSLNFIYHCIKIFKSQVLIILCNLLIIQFYHNIFLDLNLNLKMYK